MKKILLINNPYHVGIACIGDAYRKAFEYLGQDFYYLDLFQFPRLHHQASNMLIEAQVMNSRYDAVIFIQPTYLHASTYHMLMSLRQHVDFYSIHTEDPYSVSGILQMSPLFKNKFTNEKTCAEKFEKQGFIYLPVAFDSFKQYKKSSNKDYDFTMICNYYEDRIPYLNNIRNYHGPKYIAGVVSYLAMKDLEIDITGFSRNPGMMQRHKELEIYSRSKFVINPHRKPDIVGKTDFMVPQKDCQLIVKEAVSPNPRFFESIACGAIPLSDSSRTECKNIMSRHYGKELPVPVTLPVDPSYLLVFQWCKSWFEYYGVLEEMTSSFCAKESYLERAKVVLGVINK